MELEVDEVSSVGVAISVSDAAVLDPLLNGEDVAETNGGLFSINVPLGCNAYWPASKSPLGVSYRY